MLPGISSNAIKFSFTALSSVYPAFPPSAYVTDDLICGSCPQSPADIDLLAEKENVDVIFSLQEDCDTEYFKIEILDLRVSHLFFFLLLLSPVTSFPCRDTFVA